MKVRIRIETELEWGECRSHEIGIIERCSIDPSEGRLRNARRPRELTPTTSHSRLVGKLDLCSSPLIETAFRLPGNRWLF